MSGPAPNGPLVINSVTLAGGALLGMSHCPGRHGVDSDGRQWARALDADLQTIQAWGASTVLSLIEPHEFARLGVPDFAQAIARTPLQWLPVPITDMATPGAATLAAWRSQGASRAAGAGPGPARAGALRRRPGPHRHAGGQAAGAARVAGRRRHRPGPQRPAWHDRNRRAGRVGARWDFDGA